MFVRQSRLSWRVVKRFSDFKELHKAISNDNNLIDVKKLPKLPSKKIPGKRSMEVRREGRN